jgi:hypothetical protein
VVVVVRREVRVIPFWKTVDNMLLFFGCRWERVDVKKGGCGPRRIQQKKS